MNFLPVPKIMQWDWNLSQKYHCDKKILITSGCSFTASTRVLNCASSWPGYMRDRCKFDYAIDWSYPGAGNRYIADSIIASIESLSEAEKQNIFVAIMWSGIDREEEVVQSKQQPCINDASYQRTSVRERGTSKVIQTLLSYERICKTQQYLKSHNIPFAFTFYINLLFAPCLPSRDTTHTFEPFLDSKRLKHLQSLSWLPKNPKNYLYDFSFYNHYIDQSSDFFHPTASCVLDWTDNVWLPALEEKGLIVRQLDQ